MADRDRKSPPDHLIDPKKKGKSWILQNVKFLWDDSKSHGAGLYHDKDHFDNMKNYAHGRQDIDQYKPMLDIDDDEDETWMNLNWEIVSLIPKIRDIALGMLNKVGFNIQATAIDKLAQDEKKRYEARIKAKFEFRDKLNQMGINVDTAFMDEEGDPESLEELEIKKNYSYKHNMEIESEDAWQVVSNSNKFEEQLKKTKEDEFDYGVSGFFERVENGKVIIEPLDIPNCGAGFSKRRDFSDAEYFFRVRNIMIADLKAEAVDQFSDEELKKIAKSYNGKLGNSEFFDENPIQSDFDDYKITVVDWNFRSTDVTVFEKRVNKSGNKVVGRAGFKRKGEKYDRVPVKTWYKASWIANTDWLYNYGLVDNINRPKKRLGVARPNFHMYAPKMYKGKPLGKVEQLAPLADDFILDWFRLQNVKASAIPKGISINLDGLEDIDLGDGVLTKRAILDLFYKKGTVVYRTKTIENTPNYSGKPIEELQGGMGSAAAELWDSMARTIDLMNQVVGFNEMTVGSTVDPKKLKGVAEMQVQSTNHALHNIVDAARSLTESVADAVIVKVQDLLRRGGKVEGNVYRRALGKTSVEFARISPKLSHHDIAIKIEDRPTSYELQRLEEMVMASIGADKLDSQAYAIIMNTENVKVAQMLLAHYEKKYALEKHQREMEKITENNRGSTEAGLAAEQARQKTAKILHDLKLDEIYKQHPLEIEKINTEKKWDLKIRSMEAQGGVVNKEIEKEGKIDVAAINAGAAITKETIKEEKKEPSKDATK
jgi:hypothetical protein